MNAIYHVPVMGPEVGELLVHNPGGIYLDGTLGGGGHAEIILGKLTKKGKYIGIDGDPEALKNAGVKLKRYKNFKAYQSTFDKADEILKNEKISTVDGILLDLGISSWQIDQDARGFAFRSGVDLDMRMNPEQPVTAKDILNNYSREDLKKIFKEYGEERFSGKIASGVITARKQKEFKKADELLLIIDRCVDPRFAVKSYARIFQALRIEVNDELNLLKKALDSFIKLMAINARLLVITYHSLEDRIVKNFMREMENPCTCPPELPVCICGKIAEIRRIKPHFFTPSDQEVKNNPRARSAKLRAAVKI